MVLIRGEPRWKTFRAVAHTQHLWALVCSVTQQGVNGSEGSARSK